jgi:hypothetical protein
MSHKVTIRLALQGHCIETAARERLRQLLDEIISSDIVDMSLQGQYELLREFINTADFRKLRASDKRLAGLVPCKCEIYREEDGLPAVRIMEQN